jgi:hypothetical protein
MKKPLFVFFAVLFAGAALCAAPRVRGARNLGGAGKSKNLGIVRDRPSPSKGQPQSRNSAKDDAEAKPAEAKVPASAAPVEAEAPSSAATAVSLAEAPAAPAASSSASSSGVLVGPQDEAGVLPDENLKPFAPDCRQYYDLCMDNICADQTRLVYNCSTALDTFEKVRVGGMEVRKGSDLYTFAKGTCLPKLVMCGLDERNKVETEYKIKVQRDLLAKEYTDAMSYTGEEASAEAADAYWECMGQLCGEGYAECYTIEKVERRAPSCAGVLAGTARKEAVKKNFYGRLQQMQVERCSRTGGQVNYDGKKCQVVVVIGRPQMVKAGDGRRLSTGKMVEEIGRATFNVGETVECTQEYFNAFKLENPNKGRGKFNIFKGIVKAVAGVATIAAGVAVIVAGAVGGVFSGGAAAVGGAFGGIALIGAGIGFAGSGTADIINGAVLLDSGHRVGACFINGHQVAFLKEFFIINFFAEEPVAAEVAAAAAN